MQHLLVAVAHVARHDPRLAFEALSFAIAHAPATKQTGEERANPPVHFGIAGDAIAPDLIWYHGEGDARVVVAVFSEGTTRISVPAAELTLVHSPGVLVGRPYYVADPTFEPLRTRGRFDEIDDYDHDGLFEALVREDILDASMTMPAFDRWLELHDAASLVTTSWV